MLHLTLSTVFEVRVLPSKCHSFKKIKCTLPLQTLWVLVKSKPQGRHSALMSGPARPEAYLLLTVHPSLSHTKHTVPQSHPLSAGCLCSQCPQCLAPCPAVLCCKQLKCHLSRSSLLALCKADSCYVLVVTVTVIPL